MATRVAQHLSWLFQPLLTGLYLVVALSLIGTHSLRAGTAWAGVVALLAVGLPALDIALRLRARKVGDFQLAARQERIRPLLTALGCSALAVVLVALLGGPRPLLAAMLAGFVCGLALTLITLRWKISFHAGALAAGVVLLLVYAGRSGLLLSPVLVAVGWSRVHLGRHSPAQVVAGGGAAALLTALVLALLGSGRV